MKQNLLVFLSFLLSGFITSCVNQDNFPVGNIMDCDAEKLSSNKKHFIANQDSSFFFDGGKKQSNIEAHSGKYSAYTTPGSKAFALGFKLKYLKADSYFKISVWRKSKDGKGALVVSAKNSKNYYTASINAVEKRKDGWEKLEMEIFIPPLDFGENTFSFYAWNNSSDTVYFDDFKIERLPVKTILFIMSSL